MSKEIYISSTPHETRLAIVEKDELSEIYYERENEYTLAGSIYNGRVTRVLPGMQSAFVDVGLERDAFLYITDFLEEQGESADFETEEARRTRDRNERSERGERGGERRRGDRNSRPSRDGEGVSPVVTEQTVEGEQGITGIGEDEAAARAEGADEGEEGSRRWRGRRGRRRGRGAEGRPTAASGENGPQPTIYAGAEDEPEASFEVAEPARSQAEEAPVAAEPAYRRDERGRGDRAEEGRARDGRGRDGRTRERGGRDRERSPERGRRFEASAAEPAAGGPAAEPFILPGESLSKYRRGDEGPAAEATASVKAKPQANL